MPGAGDGGGLSLRGGHGGYEDRQGLGAGVAELESGAGGDIEADAGTQVQDLLIVTLLTPHLALPSRTYQISSMERWTTAVEVW